MEVHPIQQWGQVPLDELYQRCKLFQKGESREPHRTQEEIRDMILRENPEAVLIFVNPKEGTWGPEDLIRWVREDSQVPIIVCGPKDEKTLIVMLKGGADHYISFPSSLKEFNAEINATMRRMRMLAPGENGLLLTSGTLVVDSPRHQVFVNGQIVELTPTEFQLLILLMRNHGQALNHESLYRAGWNEEPFDQTSTIDSVKWHISNLRRKLGLPCIRTQRGVGYSFVGPPSSRELEKAAS